MKSRLSEEFDPDNISKQDMKTMAVHLEEFMMMHDSIMIIPDGILDKEEYVKAAKKEVRKLIDLLYEGKLNKVFKDKEDWNTI